ncbi:hypothetical protein [Amycolatopsis pigmentata]|uniref:Lipoprotein n=1 Tax=Amycolatopsis pigmentata TaxID=450801 RepID=A0ABW5G0G5_9PSEU
MSRHGILVCAAAALAVFATAACSTQTTTGSATAAVTVTSSPRQAASADTRSRLKFPNSVETVALDGYDESVHMVRFRLQVYRPGGADNGHYENDPADSALYRLALADQPQIRSAADICSNGQPTLDSQGVGVRPCTADQLLDALRAGKKSLARIRVDAADHIAELSEIYRP